MEKLYLSCVYCGEVFDEIETARAHESNSSEFSSLTPEYVILTESEAF